MNRQELEQKLPWSNERGGTIDCGDGWLWIIEELNDNILEVAPDYQVTQVKEKFGGLRYYTWNVDYQSIVSLIREAEEVAARTCERCGRPGEVGQVSRYYTAVLCAEDLARLQAERGKTWLA